MKNLETLLPGVTFAEFTQLLLYYIEYIQKMEAKSRYIYVNWPESQIFIEMLNKDREKYKYDIVMVQNEQDCMVEVDLYDKTDY